MDLNSPEAIRLTRTALAVALPNELFLYSQVHIPTATKARDIILPFLKDKDILVYPYWDKQSPVSAPLHLLVTIYKKDNRALLVIGNMGPGGNYEICINREKIGGDIESATNVETGAEIGEIRNNQLLLPVREHDFVLIELVVKKFKGNFFFHCVPL